MLACNFFVFFTLIEYCYAQGRCKNCRENGRENWTENVIFAIKKDSYSKKAACDELIGSQHEYKNGFRKVFVLAVIFYQSERSKI